MALSGSFSAPAGTTGSGQYHTLRVDWEAVQDIPGNRSTVTCRIYHVQDKNHALDIGSRTNNVCTIDGIRHSFSSPSIHNSGGVTTLLGTVSQTVNHGPDGTKTLTITVVFRIGATLGGTSYPSITASDTITLDTIARATVPRLSAGAVTLGEALDIALEPAADFTHSLRWQFGAASGIIAQDAATGASWTPPLSLAEQIPNAAAGTAIITCTTYQGAVQIGQSQSATLVLLVPETAVPTVSAQWQDTTGAFDTFGTLVQLVSSLQVDVTASGAWGSSIRGVSMTLGGRDYTGGAILDSGALALTVTAVDSRGRSGRAVYTLEVAAYGPPQLTLSASRCTEDGTADDAGSFAIVSVSGAVAELPGNSAVLTLGWGFDSQQTPLECGPFTHSCILPADPDSTLRIEASLTDALLTTTRSMTLSTGYATMDFLLGGRGIAFGTAATKEGFTCAMDMDMARKRICNVAAPVDDGDAVNLAYLRSFSPEGGGNVAVRIEGAVLILEQTQPTLSAAIDGSVLVLGY